MQAFEGFADVCRKVDLNYYQLARCNEIRIQFTIFTILLKQYNFKQNIIK